MYDNTTKYGMLPLVSFMHNLDSVEKGGIAKSRGQQIVCHKNPPLRVHKSFSSAFGMGECCSLLGGLGWCYLGLDMGGTSLAITP